MKKILLFLYAAAVSLCVTSCADFLDTENLVKKNTSNCPTNKDEVDKLLTGAYAPLWQLFGATHPYLMDNMLSGDCLGGGGASDTSLPIFFHRYQNTTDYANSWTKLYMGIYRCNMLLNSLDLIEWEDTDSRKIIEGEAYYLRGMYYYFMAVTFGTVPIVTTPEPQNNPKASSEEMFKLILSDLGKAIELLPSKVQPVSEMGHATRWAAQALQARAYLFYDGYYKNNQRQDVALREGTLTKANVISGLDDCIKNSGYSLLGEFRNQWPYAVDIPEADYKYAKDNNLRWVGEEGANTETVFAVKYSSTAGWSSPNAPYLGNSFALFLGFRGMTLMNFGGGYGMCGVNTNMWNEWSDNDIRKRGSVLDIYDTENEGVPVDGINVPAGESGFRLGGWEAMQETGYFIKKYFPVNVRMTNSSGNKVICNYSCPLYGREPNYQLDNTQDWVVIRFADVLLMHSELSQTTDGINKVRARVGLEPIAAYTDEALRNERRWELAFEGLRYQDMMRWYGQDAGKEIQKTLRGCKIYNNAMATTIDGTPLASNAFDAKCKQYFEDIDKRYRETGGFMQIPNNEILLSNGVLVQNKGWETSAAAF